MIKTPVHKIDSFNHRINQLLSSYGSIRLYYEIPIHAGQYPDSIIKNITCKLRAGRVKHQVMNPKDLTANTACICFTERYLLNVTDVDLNESIIEP